MSTSDGTLKGEPRRLIERGGVEAQLLGSLIGDEVDAREERKAWDRLKERRLHDLIRRVLAWGLLVTAGAMALAWVLSLPGYRMWSWILEKVWI